MRREVSGNPREGGVFGAALGALAFAAAVGLLCVDVVRGIWDHDAGFFLQQAAMVAAGLRPYVDFSPFYPPLMASVNALPIWLGIERYLLVTWLPIAWVVAIGALTVACGRRLAPGSSPLLTWFLAAGYPLLAVEFGGNHVTLEHAVVLCGLLALLAFGPPRRAGALAFAAAGFAGGLAVLSKQVGVLLLLPFAFQVRRGSHGASLLLGFAAPLFGLVAWLGFDGGPLLSSGAQLASYVSHDGTGGWWSILRHLKAQVLALPVSLPAEFRRATLGLVGLVGSITAGLWLLGRLREDGARRESVWVGSWLAVFGLLLATRLVKDFPHYTLNCWVPLVALWLAFLARYGPSRTFRLWGMTLGLGVGVVILHAPWNPAYTRRFEQPGTLETWILPLAAEVDRLVPAGAAVVDAQPENVVLFLARRLPANRDWSLGPFGIADVERWVPPGRPCYVLTTHIGDQGSLASMDIALRGSSRYRLEHEWKAPGRHIGLYRRTLGLPGNRAAAATPPRRGSPADTR
ncbi:MAG: hypothetical protein VKS61_08050 [Candidatus Sericytochromatia bacterium]|nr:hypothetical protein [Candidatus Sericytochromatia bacterium]